MFNGQVVAFRSEKTTPTSCRHLPLPTPRFWLYLPINPGEWGQRIVLRYKKGRREEAVLIVSQPQTFG